MFHVIGLIGKMQTGKSTIAKYLEKEYDYIPIAIADPIKDCLSRMIPNIPHDSLWGNGPKDYKIRKALQHLGDVGRDYDPDIWLHWLDIRMQCLSQNVDEELTRKSPKPRGFVISDIRLPAEVDYLTTRYRVTFIEVHKNNPNGCVTDDTHSHCTETQTSQMLTWCIQHRIDNDGNLEDLYAQIESIMKTMEPL